MSKRKRSYSKSFTLPIAPIVGLAVGMTPIIENAMKGEWQWAIKEAQWRYLGIDQTGNFDMMGLVHGLLPLALGGLVHKFVGGAPLNVNRMLANAGVPIIRI